MARPELDEHGFLRFQLRGDPQRVVHVLSSDDLEHWTVEDTVVVIEDDWIAYTSRRFPGARAFYRLSQGLVPEDREVSLDLPNGRTGLVGTVFAAKVSLPTTFPEGVRFLWDAGDGRGLEGQQVTVSFAIPGVYPLEFAAHDADGLRVFHGGTLLTVFPRDATRGLLGEPGPPSLGDANGDGQRTESDTERLRAVLSGEASLPDPQLRQLADFDFDGELTSVDLSLLEETLRSPEGWPRRMVPESGAPGTTVTVFSPLLLSAEANVELRDRRGRTVEAERLFLGRLTFTAWPDAEDFAGAIEPAEETVYALSMNGQPVETYAFRLVQSSDADAQAAIDSILTVLESIAELNTPFLENLTILNHQDLAGSLAGLEGLPMADVLTRLLGRHRQEVAHLRMVWEGWSPGDRRVLIQLAETHGLLALAEQLARDLARLGPQSNRRLGKSGPGEDPGWMTTLCLIAEYEKAIRKATTILDTACAVTVAATAVVAPKFLPLVLVQCLTMWAANEALTVVLDLLPRPGETLELDVSRDGTDASVVTMRPYVPLTDSRFCSQAAKIADGKIAEAILAEVIERLAKRIPGFQALRIRFKKQVEQVIREAIDKILQDSIGGTPIGTMLQDLTKKHCAPERTLSLARIPVRLDPADVAIHPATETLRLLEDGALVEVRCVADEGVEIHVAALVCGRRLTARTSMKCGVPRPVVVESVTFSGPILPPPREQTVCLAVNPEVISLPPGATVQWELSSGETTTGPTLCFKPAAEGDYTGELSVRSGLGEPRRIPFLYTVRWVTRVPSLVTAPCGDFPVSAKGSFMLQDVSYSSLPFFGIVICPE